MAEKTLEELLAEAQALAGPSSRLDERPADADRFRELKPSVGAALAPVVLQALARELGCTTEEAALMLQNPGDLPASVDWSKLEDALTGGGGDSDSDD